MSYGLTPTGFLPKTFEICREEIRDLFRTAFGASIDLSTSVEGFVVDIVAEREATLWELGEAVYNSQDVDSVIDNAQNKICALTGTIRREATASNVTLMLIGATGTSIAADSRVSVDSTGTIFATDVTAITAALTAWATSTAYALGDRVTSGGDAWVCTLAGTSESSGSLDSTGLVPGDMLVDNTARWVFLGEGVSAVDVDATAVETGPIVAVAGDITTIETAFSGWASVYNLTDAIPGSSVETNEALRLRREQELSASGNAPKDAIRADLLKVTDVTAVRVFHNTTNVEDADGVPPHAVECLVQGGTNEAIAARIFTSVAAGVKTHGTTTVNVTDSQGYLQEIKFSRPTAIPIYIALTLDKEASTYAGDDEVKAHIVAAAALAATTGLDAVASRVSAWAFATPGVLDISVANIGTAPTPATSTTVAINLRQLATYDTSRINVTSSDATP